MLKGAIHPFTYRDEGILATFVKKMHNTKKLKLYYLRYNYFKNLWSSFSLRGLYGW